MRRSATRENGLDAEKGIVVASAVRMLGALPSRASLASDGLRFTAMPSFGPRWYAVSVGGNGDPVVGTLAITGQHRDEYAVETTLKFTMPRRDYARAMMKIDALADGFPGDDVICLDGTPIAFERVRDTRVTSGDGSASCSEHYHAISAAVLEMMPYMAPLPDAPANPDWMPNGKLH